jgi:Protein phosphatase 2C
VTWPSLAGDVVIAACADGAGSASHSHLGSQIACDTFLELSLKALNQTGEVPLEITREGVVEWYGVAKERIEREAVSLGLPSRELASTLLFALVTPAKATFAQVGDGAIVVKRGDDYVPVFWPQSGEYANTTNFLTSDDLDHLIDFRCSEEEVTDLAMFSDGLERLVLRFADRSVHRPSLEPLFTHLRAAGDIEALFAPLRQFLNSKAVNERTDDDKTLILASRLL